MGTQTERFRDRLPLSPLTVRELAAQADLAARCIADDVVSGRETDPQELAEYVCIRDAIAARLGLPVSGRSSGSS